MAGTLLRSQENKGMRYIFCCRKTKQNIEDLTKPLALK
jgi:hypothetical protein